MLNPRLLVFMLKIAGFLVKMTYKSIKKAPGRTTPGAINSRLN